MSYYREKAWIRKKLRSGVTREELRECVGIFSNRDKKKVMSEKQLSEKSYRERYKFLSNVYLILSSK